MNELIRQSGGYVFGDVYTVGFVRPVPTAELEEVLRRVQRVNSAGNLSIKGSHLTPRAIQIIGSMRSLTSLNLNETGVSDLDMSELARLTRLRLLAIVEPYSPMESRVTDAGIVKLSTLSQLTDLNVAGTEVTEAGIRELGKRLPKLDIEWTLLRMRQGSRAHNKASEERIRIEEKKLKLRGPPQVI